MTRIFDALRKLQPAPAVPFAPAAPALQPVPGRATAAPRGEAAPPPVVESVTAASLAADVEREMAALRVGLESALEERATRVVLFMSSVGGEGTTSVASEFASLLAGDPRLRVVVVDLNARRPALAARFAPQGEPAARSREPG
ncbi:MAG: hypothetical protein HY076_04290, partial [Candidatus Eisenbacteria bacterium]|nr:hypothetical protein [Candidatus Eisenbacteria bacterium]